MITKVTVAVLLLLSVTCAATGLPEAPSQRVKLTRLDYALASASVAGAAFDAWTTAHNISRGCVELNPMLGSRPSPGRVWAEESALTGVQLFAAWEFKRHGHAHIAGFMLGGDAAMHLAAGIHNMQIAGQCSGPATVPAR